MHVVHELDVEGFNGSSKALSSEEVVSASLQKQPVCRILFPYPRFHGLPSFSERFIFCLRRILIILPNSGSLALTDLANLRSCHSRHLPAFEAQCFSRREMKLSKTSLELVVCTEQQSDLSASGGLHDPNISATIYSLASNLDCNCLLDF
ncbi:hypothetical protein AKJ16_DCAP16995 [Drosera capensis]